MTVSTAGGFVSRVTGRRLRVRAGRPAGSAPCLVLPAEIVQGHVHLGDEATATLRLSKS